MTGVFCLILCGHCLSRLTEYPLEICLPRGKLNLINYKQLSIYFCKILDVKCLQCQHPCHLLEENNLKSLLEDWRRKSVTLRLEQFV